MSLELRSEPPRRRATQATSAEKPTQAEVTEALSYLIEDSCAIEIRAPKYNGTKNVVSRFKPGACAEPARVAWQLSGKAPAIYVVMNGVNPTLPVGLNLRGGARAEDIPSRRHILIDYDPVRPAKTNATLAEKRSAAEVSERIREYLAARQWPDPLHGDSGNGYHVVYPTDLPANEETTALIKDLLKVLDARFSTPNCKIDTSVYDLPRLVKVYGTLAAKGENTEERPHRYSRVLLMPAAADRGCVTVEMIRAVIKDLDPPKESAATAQDENTRPNDTEENGRVKPPWINTAVDGPTAASRARAYVFASGFPDSIERNRGHDRLFHVAAVLVDGFGLNRAEAEPIFRDWNQQKAKPSESEGQVQHKLDSVFNKFPAPSRKLLLADRDGFNGNAAHVSPTPDGDAYKDATDAQLGITDSTEVKVENPEWLWPRRFLKGKINLIAGEGGDGKTTFAIYVGAVVINGGTFADGESAGEPGRVLMMAAEDGWGDTIKPRFIAAGAILKPGSLKFLKARVDIPKTAKRPAMVNPVSLQNLTYWRRVFELEKPTLLIIDPLPAYLGRGVNDHKHSEVQAVLNAFADLATEFGVCVIAITHTGKATDRKLIHKILGSVAYTNVARAVHATIRDLDDPSIRYLERAKCNLDEQVEALEFKLVSVEVEHEGKTLKTSKAEIEPEPVAIDAEAMARPRNDGASRRGPTPKKGIEFAEWLYDFLDGRTGWLWLSDIREAAGAKGLIGTPKYNEKGHKCWSNIKALYRGRDQVPELEPPRAGKRIEEQDMKQPSDHREKKAWRLRARPPWIITAVGA
jgi:hypothetical protein